MFVIVGDRIYRAESGGPLLAVYLEDQDFENIRNMDAGARVYSISCEAERDRVLDWGDDIRRRCDQLVAERKAAEND